MEWFYRINRQLVKLTAGIYFRLKVEDSRHIPSTGPLLLAANHCSFLDPPLIAAAISRQISFLAKEELFRIPLLGWWIHHLGAYPLARQKGDTQAVRTGLRVLRENKVLLVFPEGTRSPDGELLPLQPGAAWLSLIGGAPVVPLYISGSFRACPRNAWWPRPTQIRIAIGTPIKPEEIEPNGERDVRIEFMNELLRREFYRLKNFIESKNLNRPPLPRLNNP
jgi:1-acyl-sn-glycerol-3-phosphate acyltransferase